MERLLEPVVRGVADGTLVNNIMKFQNQMEKILRSLSTFIGFGKLSRQGTREFVTFLIDTKDAFEFLQIPNPLPILAKLNFPHFCGVEKS